MDETLSNELVDLLQRAGAAHGVYEREELNSVYDQQWSVWYAGWLLENGLSALLNTPFDLNMLGKLLHDLNEELKQAQTDETWARFTARRLIELHSP